MVSKKFISYKDDKDQIIQGYFEVLKETDNYIKFKSGSNIIMLPWNRILKVKQSLKGERLDD